MERVTGNIYRTTRLRRSEEFQETLLNTAQARIERIVSYGHASPVDFWYDQPQNEWVLLLAGRAGLRFDNEDEECLLEAGDYILIPAHQRHRVAWTDPAGETIWLAVHFK